MRIFVALLLVGTAWAAEPETKEPPLVFYFEVGGKRVPVELDAPFSTQALAAAKSATLRLEPHREFAYAGLRFRYPREYTFEADLDSANLAMWTLSGNDCKLMIHRYKGQASAEAIHRSVVDGILKAFGAAKKKEGPIALAGTPLKGARIEVQIASSTIQQDVYALRSGKDVTILIIQDSPKENGKSSRDRVTAEKLLVETLKLP